MNLPKAGRAALPQHVDTPLTTLPIPLGTVLALYARSVDSVNANTVGQDFVTFRYDEQHLTFAVCDGVGQSFMGELAARILGEALIDWLWGLKRPASEENFAMQVTGMLNEVTGRSKAEIAAHALPPSLPPILRQALEMQRSYGSESMFVAGRVSTGPAGWVGLCWLGDSPVAAVDVEGALLDLGPKGSTAERWNAATGVKGQVHTWLGDVDKVARVAGYTDGLGLNKVPIDADLARLMAHWAQQPPADDASLFDVRLAPSPLTVGAALPPAVHIDEGVGRQPVTGVTPLPAEDIPAQMPITGTWRPIQPGGGPKPSQNKDAATLLSDTQALVEAIRKADIKDATKAQQVQMWQQAALLGLTSAALAMLMMERLIKEAKDNTP